MAARPGEDLAATLFADIHYYYGNPSSKPPHHRFDKGSYVYLFESPSQRRARIEIANNVGTPEQDAFNGYLDGAHIKYSYKHSNLVTLTVESTTGQRSVPLESPEWHLPTFDPRNETKYMYKLHILDIYFWAKEDALLFLNGVRRVLPQQQITVQDEPVAPPPHHEDMSPVVQKLENVAITDPSYQHGRTRDSRTSGPSAGGPPISATPKSQEASNFAPMPYNPAAPAAPESIMHREKTPPPEDGQGNPLTAAAAADQGQIYSGHYQNPGLPGQQPQPQGIYFPGPSASSSIPPAPSSRPLPSASVQSPFAQHFQHSFAPPPTAPTNSSSYAQPPAAATSPPTAPATYQQQPSSQNVPVTQFASYPGSPAASSAMTSPGIYSPGLSSPLPNPGIYSPAQPAAPAAAAPPPGGFSQFQYGSMSKQKPLPSSDYSVHQQVYRPTENEGSVKHHEKPAKPPSGKFEQRAGALEKGVGSFLKKLEKKIG